MNKPRYDVISIFPEYLNALSLSLVGKAQENNLIEIGVTDLRTYAQGVHKSVDDTPYGGGAGMVMSPERLIQSLVAHLFIMSSSFSRLQARNLIRVWPTNYLRRII